MRHDPLLVRMEIEKFLADNPVLADDEMLRADMLEGSTSLHEAAREMLHYVQDRQAMAAGIDLWIDTLKQRRDRLELGAEGGRHVLFSLMQSAGIRHLQLPEATLSIRNGSPKVIITDEAVLPETFVRIKREPDKASIKAALQDGITVPGATLSNAEEYITVRTK